MFASHGFKTPQYSRHVWDRGRGADALAPASCRTLVVTSPELPIKIASWNVNSIRARMPLVIEWLERQQPHVLLMQELKGIDFPTDTFAELGYASAAVTQKTYNGVAILSRSPIETISTVLAGEEEDSHARFLETIIRGENGDLRVVNIYLPNGNPVGTAKFEYKLRWMERLRMQMSAWLASPVPTIIGGDFNVIPQDADCHKPASWVRDALFQPETRAAYRSFLSLGYVDAFRALHPEATGEFTYWDYFRNAFETNRGIRIDHFLLSPTLAGQLDRCEIDRTPRAREKPSDHTPIVVEVRS